MESLEYEKVEGLPKSSRPNRLAGGVSPYAALVEACVANPGEWFRTIADTQQQAYSRVSTLKKHGLEAHARGVEVYCSYAGEPAEQAV